MSDLGSLPVEHQREKLVQDVLIVVEEFCEGSFRRAEFTSAERLLVLVQVQRDILLRLVAVGRRV